MQKRNLISITDLTKEEIIQLLRRAKEFEQNPNQRILEGKVVGSLFFEPSTRTRLSFETAVNRLGGRVIGFSDASTSSQSKGETLKDTIMMVSNYADLIVMRHPLEGAARYASEVSITMVGDLKYGRTVHSLLEAMHFFNPRFKFVACNELRMPEQYKAYCRKLDIEYEETTEFSERIINQTDILYMTRVQRERFSDLMEYERVKNVYTLTASMLKGCKPNMRVLHPLPRVTEIAQDVDDTPQAYYFEQARNGLYARQALICRALGI